MSLQRTSTRNTRRFTKLTALLFFASFAAPAAAANPWQDKTLPAAQRAKLLLAAMTQAQKLSMVHGTVGAPAVPAPVNPGGVYAFANAANLGACIDAKGAGTDNKTPLQEYQCNNSGAQTFTAADAGGGAVKLVNTGSNRCLELAGGVTTNDTPAQLYDCNNTPAQTFQLKPTANGQFTIYNAISDKCLEIAGGNTATGTLITVHTCNNTIAQSWQASIAAYVGAVPAIPELGVPALALQDAQAGVADGVGQVTAFPAPISLAAAWDADLAQKYGSAVAVEHAGKGVNVVLGPMMNIDRVPQAGRNFEGLGEDPFLAGQLAAALTRGIQSQGLIATAKHFIDNDQETDRGTINVIVDDRTQHEIYLPAFEACVAAGVGAVMCSYNLVNGVYACENDQTQNGWLKGELGFQGFIMSDWGGTHSSAAAALGGLDLEMPDYAKWFGKSLASDISSGAVPQSRLDDMVTRTLTSMFQAGLFDRAPSGSLGANVATDASAQVSRTVGTQSLVLLKNADKLLPFDSTKLHSIAVIGNAGDDNPVAQGGGSSHVHASFVISPFQGIKARAGAGVTVSYANSTIDSAVSLAKKSDVAVVVVGVTSGEGDDRKSLSLPDGSDALVSAVLAANPRTVVVVYSPAQVLLPWAGDTPAILEGFLPGQEQGEALAAVLFGDVNPSGKLPLTIANQAADYPANTPEQFPGVNGAVTYSEGFLVGYRHFDHDRITPLFPFGHGLSYTTFAYEKLALSSATVTTSSSVSVSLDVSNSGAVAGAEVVQLYLGLPAETSEPKAQLVGFQKVQLAPGASQHLTFKLDPASYSFWSAGLGKWVAYPGEHVLSVGSSSRDLRLTGKFEVQGGPLAGTPYPAEAATLAGGAATATDHSGFSGASYVTGFTKSGAKTQFNVMAPSAGRYALTLRYAATKKLQTLRDRKSVV